MMDIEDKILTHFITEFKLLIHTDGDYEGITIKNMLDDYLEVKRNPKVSIEIDKDDIFHCETPEDAIAFLGECASRGIFMVAKSVIGGYSFISTFDAMNLFDETLTAEPYQSADFLFLSPGDKLLMRKSLKSLAEHEQQPLIIFKANKKV